MHARASRPLPIRLMALTQGAVEASRICSTKAAMVVIRKRGNQQGSSVGGRSRVLVLIREEEVNDLVVGNLLHAVAGVLPSAVPVVDRVNRHTTMASQELDGMGVEALN